MTLKCSPTRVPHGSLTSVILAITMVVIKFLSIMGYIRILGGMCQQCASFLSGSVHSWQLSESSLGAGHQQYQELPKTGNTILCSESHVTRRVRERKRVASKLIPVSPWSSQPQSGDRKMSPKLWVESGEEAPTSGERRAERGLVPSGKGWAQLQQSSPLPSPGHKPAGLLDTFHFSLFETELKQHIANCT